MADKKSEVRIPEEHLHLNGKTPPSGSELSRFGVGTSRPTGLGAQ